MTKVSVIIPVYKVEKFIGRCTRSLMDQTLDDVEFIFVDDASPDGSIGIVESIVSEYPQRNVRILKHEVNKGLPAARNTGLAEACGEYVYHCDSDDWVESTLLEKMYSAASESDNDFVYCDFFLSFEKNERYMRNLEFNSAEEALRRGFLGGTMKYNVWNKLIRRGVYNENGIKFPEGHGMGEDMTIIQCLAVSKSVKYVPEALYHYVKLNGEAFSNTMSERHLRDIRFNMDRTLAFLEERYGNSLEKEISFFKLSCKLPFLITDDRGQYKVWREWYPEANRFAMANGDVPLRTRLLQWMAAKNFWFGVRLYYLLVYRFVYGILYK